MYLTIKEACGKRVHPLSVLQWLQSDHSGERQATYRITNNPYYGPGEESDNYLVPKELAKGMIDDYVKELDDAI
jgi:hypothetical protein